MKTKLVIVLVLIASIAMFGTGAFAWFNSQTINTGNISSGTLTLRVDAGAATKNCATMVEGESTTVWSMAGVAPGDKVDGLLCLKNTGTIDAKQVTFEWVYDPALRPLADKIMLIAVHDSTDVDYPAVLAQFVSMADGIIPSTTADGKVSFAELAYLSNRYSYPFDAVSGGTPFLPAGGIQSLYMQFQFDDSADNSFQGLSFAYTLKVIAEQRNVFP